MKAWITAGDGIDGLRAVELPRPSPGRGEVAVEMRAWSLNYRDLLVIRGESTWRPAAPITPISDGAGVVVETGDGVARVTPGDRVSAMFLPHWRKGPLTEDVYHSPTGGPTSPGGVLADYIVLPEEHLEHVPTSLTDPEAATLPIAALTAWHAVAVRCDVRPGDRVLVHGTGGVALFALQIATALGAQVLVSTSSERKAARLHDLGAARAVNRHETDVAAAALEWTDGRGVDHVIETVGGENLNTSLRAVAIGGSIAFIGLIAGLSAPINTYEFVTKNIELHGIETGSAQMYADLARFIDNHGLKPVIDSTYPATQIAAALRRLERGGHFGKIVLTAG